VSFGAQPPSNLNVGTVCGLFIIWHNHTKFSDGLSNEDPNFSHGATTFKTVFYFKPDIEISGGSKKKTGQTVDFPNTILCYDETKNKAQPIVGESRLIASPESANTKSY